MLDTGEFVPVTALKINKTLLIISIEIIFHISREGREREEQKWYDGENGINILSILGVNSVSSVLSLVSSKSLGFSSHLHRFYTAATCGFTPTETQIRIKAT